MSVGRPPLYTTNDEVVKIIDEYFDECDKKNKPYTVAGLSYALNMTRETLVQYGRKEKYSDAITRAKQKVHEYAETRLFDKDGARGAEFSLKCNYKWRDNDANETDMDSLDDVIVTIRKAAKKQDES